MNDLMEKLNSLPAQIAAAEQEAVKHEVAARQCRTQRENLKQELSQTRAAVNDAKVVIALESSCKAAQGAQQAAEVAKTEAQAVLASLKDKETQLDGKLEELDDRLLGLHPTPDPE